MAGEMIYYDLYDDDDTSPATSDPPTLTDSAAPQQGEDTSVELDLSDETTEDSGGTPISPEELEKLLQQGVDMNIRQGNGDGANRRPRPLHHRFVRQDSRPTPS